MLRQATRSLWQNSKMTDHSTAKSVVNLVHRTIEGVQFNTGDNFSDPAQRMGPFTFQGLRSLLGSFLLMQQWNGTKS